jgi:hypothetical protein
MRRYIIAAVMLIFTAVTVAFADQVVYTDYFVNEPALTYSKSFTIDLNNKRIDTIAWQVNYASASISSMTFTGTAVSSGSYIITIPTHSLTTAFAVRFTTNSGIGLRPLVNQTTYFVNYITSNTFAVVDTATGAINNLYIKITTNALSSTQYGFIPVPFSGTPSFKWQSSNDNTNWFDLPVASFTAPSPLTPGTTSWNFGPVYYRYQRVNFSSATAGGFNLQILGNGKNSGAR